MSTDPKELRAEEKTRILEEALDGDKEHVKEVAEKYDLDVELLETWIREKDVTYVKPKKDHLEDQENVDLQVTKEFADDYEFGATPDNLNYRTLFFWSAFGTTVIVLFIVAIFFVYEYTYQGMGQQSADQSHFYEIEQQREQDSAHLNSFGVVDLDEGIYRIPIDSAITRLAQDTE